MRLLLALVKTGERASMTSIAIHAAVPLGTRVQTVAAAAVTLLRARVNTVGRE